MTGIRWADPVNFRNVVDGETKEPALDVCVREQLGPHETRKSKERRSHVTINRGAHGVPQSDQEGRAL